jgi:hypothetical protein
MDRYEGKHGTAMMEFSSVRATPKLWKIEHTNKPYRLKCL